MKSNFHLSTGFFAGIAALALASPLGSLALETPSLENATPGLKLQVLESVEVIFPDRSILYQRVAPPSQPAIAPRSPETKPLSPAEIAAAEARAKKKFEVMTIFATVYDHRVTELRWSVGSREFCAWSNLDFNYLAGHGEVETDDSIYFLIMGIGNGSAEAATQNFTVLDSPKQKALPPAERFSSMRSEYFLADELPELAPPEALAAMDALHSYYDANRERIVEAYTRREAERIARQQWLREHPPKPKDTVIQFWPKKSRNYPTGK